MNPVEVFEANRSRLFGVAYGMIGEVAEAEDLVQDAWLRWSTVDPDTVSNPAGFLTTVITRLAIDRLRSAQRRREAYVGTWLPDPHITAGSLTAGAGRDGTGPDDLVAAAETLSMALLVALERLNPVERAVLLLRDVFDLDYDEVAAIVDRAVANCRQIARRARVRVGDTSRSAPAPPGRERVLTEAFVAAVADGDLDRLTAVLAEDVGLWSDGGGRVRSAVRPILGRHRVSRFLLGTRPHLAPGARLGFTRANGDPALYVAVDGRPSLLMVLEIDHDRIVAVRNHLNPDRLVHLPVIDTPHPVELAP